jgi:ribosomal protein L32
MDKYTLDKCKSCGEYKALRNDICAECEKMPPLPDFLKDLFRKKEK